MQTLTPKQRSIVRVQHILLFPVLLFARLSWCLQSVLFPLSGKLEFSKAAFEAMTLSCHYVAADCCIHIPFTGQGACHAAGCSACERRLTLPCHRRSCFMS